MNRIGCGVICVLLALAVITANAQEGSIVRRLGEAIVETITKKGGKEAAEELTRIGGGKTVKEAVEKAAAEGGEELAKKLEKYTAEYGLAFLKGAKRSPKTFIDAFEGLPQGLRDGAIQAVRREPELMSGLVEKCGTDALAAAARHPGIAGQIMTDLGQQGAMVAKDLTTDAAIRLGKISGDIAKLPGTERSAVLDLIRRTPEKVLDLLEKHPTVLKTGAVLTAFLASKDQLFGRGRAIVRPDGTIVQVSEPGFFERLWESHRIAFAWPIGVLGAAVAFWACIKLWATYRVSRMKVEAAARRNALQSGNQEPSSRE